MATRKQDPYSDSPRVARTRTAPSTSSRMAMKPRRPAIAIHTLACRRAASFVLSSAPAKRISFCSNTFTSAIRSVSARTKPVSRSDSRSIAVARPVKAAHLMASAARRARADRLAHGGALEQPEAEKTEEWRGAEHDGGVAGGGG